MKTLLDGTRGIGVMASREKRWKSGRACAPMAEYRRYMLPNNGEPPTPIDPALVAALKAIDRDFEFVFDRHMQVKCKGPAYCVVLRFAGGGSRSNDILRHVVPVQKRLAKDLNIVWPLGKPCLPGPWIIPIIRMHYTGPLENNPRLRDSIAAGLGERKRAEDIAENRRLLSHERDVMADILPYCDGSMIRGGRGRTMAKSGFGPVGRGKTP